MSPEFVPKNKNAINLPQIKSSIKVPETKLDVEVDKNNEALLDGLPTIQVKELPSKGLPYPKGWSISYRVYKFGEIKTYNQSKLGVKDELAFVLEGIKTSFDKLSLTLSDLLYIGFLRKLSSLGAVEYAKQYNCYKCGSVNELKFSTKDIYFEDLSMEKLPVVATLSVGELHFNPLTIKQYFELIDEDKHTSDIDIMAAQCLNKSKEEARRIIYNLLPEDGETMNEVDKLLYHDIKPLDHKCKNCSVINVSELNSGGTIIYPFREHKVDVSNKIRFGV